MFTAQTQSIVLVQETKPSATSSQEQTLPSYDRTIHQRLKLDPPDFVEVPLVVKHLIPIPCDDGRCEED